MFLVIIVTSFQTTVFFYLEMKTWIFMDILSHNCKSCITVTLGGHSITFPALFEIMLPCQRPGEVFQKPVVVTHEGGGILKCSHRQRHLHVVRIFLLYRYEMKKMLLIPGISKYYNEVSFYITRLTDGCAWAILSFPPAIINFL